MFLCTVCVQCSWSPGACTESPGTSITQAVNYCVSAGDPAWFLKEQLVLSLSDSSLPTDAPNVCESLCRVLCGAVLRTPHSLCSCSHTCVCLASGRNHGKGCSHRTQSFPSSVPFRSTELSGVSDSCQRSKRTLGTLELEFRMVVSYCVGAGSQT